MADEPKSLWSLLGAVDNLSEPMPVWNKQSTMVAMTVASWICVLLRLYARVCVTHNQGWDDALVFFLQFFGTAGAVCICLASAAGFGQHFLLIGMVRAKRCIKLFYVANATYALQAALIKISILLQYLRMLPSAGSGTPIQSSSRMRIWCRCLIVASALWGAVYSVMGWVPCMPVHGYWDFDLVLAGGARCWGFGSQDPFAFDAAFASHNATNMLLDALVLLTSIPLHFFQSTGSQSRKSLCGLIVLGSLVLFIAVWRFASVVEHRSATYPTFDPTWYGASSMLLGMVEINLASICACLPIFWPVFKTQMESIKVTHEVEVTREERWPYFRGEAIQLRDTETYKTHFKSTRPREYFNPGGDA